MSAIESVLVPGCLKLASNSRSGGVTVNKGGYHSTRSWLRANKPNDYSIQTANDHLGPSDEGAAFDWVFDDARAGNFKTIAKFSNRLYQAGKNHDKRAYPMREFYGNIDLDRDVEGWSYYRDRPGSSDSSHLWHIHFSIWRKYINDANAMRSILSILGAQDQQEEDMPLTDADVKKIWSGVPVVENVWHPKSDGTPGPPIVGSTAMEEDGRDGNRIQANLAALQNQVKALDAKINALIAKLP